MTALETLLQHRGLSRLGHDKPLLEPLDAGRFTVVGIGIGQILFVQFLDLLVDHRE